MNIVKRFNVYRGLPRSIYVLFAVRIVNSMGNFVYPFLTFFLTERLKFTPEVIGTYFLASAFSQSIGSIIGGKLTDHFGRKKLMIGFMGVSAACFIPCSFLGNSIIIPGLLILSGLFSGASQPVNSAMVTDLSTKDNRKLVFSLLYMGSNIGFAVGPMIAGYLYKSHTNWIFYGNSFAIMISIVLIALFVKESMPEARNNGQAQDVNDDEAAEEGGVIKALLRRPFLLLFSAGRLVYQMVYSCIGYAIPLQLGSLYGSTVGPQYYGMMASFNGLVVILFTILITRITIKMKPMVNMALAGLFYAVGFGMIGSVGTLPMFLMAAFIYTTGEILDVTNAGVYVANHSPVTHRGRFSAVISMITSAGFAIGPYLFGKFISSYGLPKLWYLCFLLAVLSGLFLLFLYFVEARHDRAKRFTETGVSN